MPIIDAEGCPIHVEIEGPQAAPVLILSNSLGTTLHMWDPHVTPLTEHFRLLRFDRRGHGKSGVPARPYSMERLGRDVLASMNGVGIRKASVGVPSLGRLDGMWLVAKSPVRFHVG